MGVLSFVPGCAKLEHLDQLLTLKDMSEEGDRLDRYVKSQDKKFEALMEAVKTNSIKNYSTKRKVMETFGDPIFGEKIKSGDMELERLLYRYAKGFFNSPKVYLYFDNKNELAKWTYFEPPPEAQAQASSKPASVKNNP